jgi:hypothetical protein
MYVTVLTVDNWLEDCNARKHCDRHVENKTPKTVSNTLYVQRVTIVTIASNIEVCTASYVTC